MTSFMEEIVWGEGTSHLDTFEILMERDLTFFTTLLTEERRFILDPQVTLKQSLHSGGRRKTSIKQFILKCAYNTEGYDSLIRVFEYQLAYLLLMLSPSLTHLTLLGLPKPQYLTYPHDVGTGTWGGSVGKVFEILGSRALRFIQELTIEAADTRYEVAETALTSWIMERSVYVKPPTEDELRRKGFKVQDEKVREYTSEDDTEVPCPISEELEWSLFGRFHHKDYLDEGEPHLNCDAACAIHGSTSGTFVLEKTLTKSMWHANPLLRRQPPKRKFQHLHLINCPEPWPAFYTLACLHPPTTMHFSSPWMDSSSSDVPDSQRKLGIEKSRFAVVPELRKVYGGSPVFPGFNQASFTAGLDHSDRVHTSPRPAGTNRLHCRRIRKKMEHFMSMIQNSPAEASVYSSSLVTIDMKRIELRTLERVSMKLLQNIVKWYGKSLELIGISRLDGTYKEASATGHVRGWGKILGRCLKLKELRVVWNLFDDVDWDREKLSGTKMRFGIGERSVGGKEALVEFSEEEWWDSPKKAVVEEKETIQNDDSSSELDNGEGPSTPRPTPEATSAPNPPTVSADKSSESREGDSQSKNAKSTVDPGSSPIEWMQTWYAWPKLKKFFPPKPSSSSYITAAGSRYLMRSLLDSPDSDSLPSSWTHMANRKELLVFLIDWKYRKLQNNRSNYPIGDRIAQDKSQGLYLSNFTQNSQTTCTSIVQEHHESTKQAHSGAGSSTLNLPYFQRSQAGRWFSPSLSATPHKGFPSYRYPFVPMEKHNATVFAERLGQEYLAREKVLATTIWDIIDADMWEGKVIDKNEWRDRFLAKTSAAMPNGSVLQKGIIFTTSGYNEYEGDTITSEDNSTKRFGPWENALNELLAETPPVFNVYTHDTFTAFDHQYITSQLSDFFHQINLWHRKLRLESTLGNGFKRFCGLSWVMFEEVPTLERVVGLLENGREVVAYPVRRYNGGANVVEMVKIRCWYCGGGWASEPGRHGSLKSGKAPIRTRVGNRECRCEFPSAQCSDAS